MTKNKENFILQRRRNGKLWKIAKTNKLKREFQQNED